jgi:hypothetical protein
VVDIQQNHGPCVFEFLRLNRKRVHDPLLLHEFSLDEVSLFLLLHEVGLEVVHSAGHSSHIFLLLSDVAALFHVGLLQLGDVPV